MSFEPPDGILDIGNATLRVGKLEVAETSGLNQGLLNIVKNNLLITENTEYSINHHWGIKLPTTWVADFDVKGHSGKYVEFNFYNEDKTSNTSGYTLNFKDTSLTLRYDGGDPLGGGVVTIPTIVDTYRKVNIFFERNVIAVSIDGTRVLYDKRPSVLSRVISTTGSAFVNVFIEQNASNSKFKNLRIVNGRFISDQTSNIAFIGGNLGVGVNSPQETLDIWGNMHFNRVSNVSSISVDSNVVTEYTGPHDRPLRKYPEVAMTADAATASGYKGYVVTASSVYNTTSRASWMAFDYPASSLSTATAWASITSRFNQSGIANSNDTFQGVNGPYIQLQMPNPILLDHFIIKTPADTGGGCPPKKINLYASNDNTTFTTLVLNEVLHGIPGTDSITHVTTQTRYKYFALQVTEMNPGTSVTSDTQYTWTRISDLAFYGHEEGSGSLDTTLKTVYNVPATTGTQLEVYYDGQNYTAMPSTVTDLAGGDQNGAVTGVTLDETGGIESFNFDGNDYISTTVTGLTGTSVTMSVWVNVNSIDTSRINSIVGLGAYPGSGSSIWIAIDGSQRFYTGISGSSKTVENSSAFTNNWVHLTMTIGNGELALYQDATIIGKVSGVTFNPDSNPVLYLGTRSDGSGNPESTRYFTGSIANFRLYSKALNAGQVQELYDYQKDYFLGSKSQVTLYKGHLGVGVTEPSGQLELAGDERIQEYPPRAITVLDYHTHIEGHGEFEFYSSQGTWAYSYRGSSAWDFTRVFTPRFTTDGGWHGDSLSTPGTYQVVGVYAPAVTSGDGVVQSILKDGSVVYGDWIEMRSPYAINVTRIATAPRTNYGKSRGIGKFVILGSNNGTDWENTGNGAIAPHDISSTTDAGGYGTYQSEKIAHVSINSNGYYYTYHRLVVTHIMGHRGASGHPQYGSGQSESVNQSYLRFFGTPGPTTLDKGSLTLGRSLDVPRVSRYDVDTETPRPEKLLVDFDTTVNNSPTDISGKANHGRFGGSAYYSSADKAFILANNPADTSSASTHYIEAELGNSETGNQYHSVSLWVKVLSGQNSSWRAVFESSENPRSGNGSISLYVKGGTDILVFAHGSGNLESDPVSNLYFQWHHVVLTYDGANRKMYLDGELIKTIATTTWSGVANMTLRLGKNNATSGNEGCDCHISNFKMYWQTALENSEIRKIYNLGRTGRSMVISDTAVGIGKVPEAQLDVRGIVRATTFISESQPLFIARPTSSIVYTTDGTIISNWTTLVNRGGFLKSSGYAYAPSAGVYYFHANMYNETNQIGILDLYHNGVIVARGELGAGVTNNSIVTLFATIHMEAGDYVYLKNIGDVELIASGSSVYNQFVGYKLS